MFEKLFKKTKESAKRALEDTKNKIDDLTISANKFVSDGNNQMKIITIVLVSVGVAMTLSNLVSITTNIYNARHIKEPKIINNIYIYKEKIK